MEKVLIIMNDGSKMLFPKQYAKKIERKNQLVARALQLQNIQRTTQQMGFEVDVVLAELKKIAGQIRSINRSVPPCGEVVR